MLDPSQVANDFYDSSDKEVGDVEDGAPAAVGAAVAVGAPAVGAVGAPAVAVGPPPASPKKVKKK